jgi:hypothetical protein
VIQNSRIQRDRIHRDRTEFTGTEFTGTRIHRDRLSIEQELIHRDRLSIIKFTGTGYLLSNRIHRDKRIHR